MGPEQWLGWSLVGAGALDCVLAVALVGPRARDPQQRAIVIGAMVSGGVLMMLLGGAFLIGVIPLAE